jgi:hypothetical protein
LGLTTATKNVPNTPTPVPNAPLTEEIHSRPTTHQENHPTFAYLPIHETFFDNNDDNNDNENKEDKPPQIPLASPDAMTSFTRTDFTYPPIEDLTRTLLKYAKTTNLRKLSYPTDLLSRRRQFNTFMDNLILCATYHHGHTFGQNKSAIIIHALVQPSTT